MGQIGGLVLTRLGLPLLVVGLMLIVIHLAALGVLVALAFVGFLGYLTQWHGYRRDMAGSAAAFVPTHRIMLDDGTSSHLLAGEGNVKPGPTKLLSDRYAAAWSTRPEAVVRVAPALLRSLALDVVGLLIGTILFLAFIIALTHL